MDSVVESSRAMGGTTSRARARWLQRSGWLVPGLFLIGLLLRLAVWWPNRGYEPFGDEQYYHRAALLFAQSGQYIDPPTPAWLPVHRVPLLSLLAGLSFRLVGPDLGPVNLIQIGLSLATAWLVWRWAAMLWGTRAGHWALALSLIAPPLITHPASFLYTETLYTFLAALALYLLGRLAAAPAWPTLTRASAALAALAGLAIGLTALTRSSGLALLGVAVLWLALSGWRQWRRTVPLTLVLVIATTLTIAPWTVRNYRTYGGLLLLDTIGAYNLWRDNTLPGENPAAVLVRLASPIDRQRVATERGLANLREHPDRFLAKLPQTTLYLWHLELDSYARGGGYFEDLTNRTDSFAWALAADLAHLAISGLALIGLSLAPWRRDRSPGQRRLQGLLVLWIMANLASGIVFHSESRFRIPYLPQLIVFAACSLVAGRSLLASARQQPWRGLLAVGLVLLLLAGAWSPRLGPVLAMQGWVTVGNALGLWAPERSLAAYGQAVAAFPESDRPYTVLGDAYRRLGKTADAMAAYRDALARQPHSLEAAVPLIYLHLQAGQADEARQVVRSTGTSDVDLIAWTWRSTRPPPVAELDVGTGLELGYLTNFYAPEEDRQERLTYRWTNGSGVLRLTAPAAGANRLSLRFNGTRLTGPPVGRVEIIINGRLAGTVAADGRWQSETIDLRPLNLPAGGELIVELRSDSFIPSATSPTNRDSRRLGIAVDRLTVE